MRGTAPKELVGGQGDCPTWLSARQGWDLSEQKTAQCRGRCARGWGACFNWRHQGRLSGATEDSRGKRWRDGGLSIHGRGRNALPQAPSLHLVSSNLPGITLPLKSHNFSLSVLRLVAVPWLPHTHCSLFCPSLQICTTSWHHWHRTDRKGTPWSTTTKSRLWDSVYTVSPPSWVFLSSSLFCITTTLVSLTSPQSASPTNLKIATPRKASQMLQTWVWHASWGFLLQHFPYCGVDLSAATCLPAWLVHYRILQGPAQCLVLRKYYRYLLSEERMEGRQEGRRGLWLRQERSMWREKWEMSLWTTGLGMLKIRCSQITK